MNGPFDSFSSLCRSSGAFEDNGVLPVGSAPLDFGLGRFGGLQQNVLPD